MASKKVDSLKKEILNCLQQSSNNLSLSEMLSQLKMLSHKRAIQRLLTDLVNEKSIYRLGKGRATRYQASLTSTSIDNFSLSDDTKEIIQIVSQNISKRNPVSYHRKLLDDYQPNKTNYLDQSMRERLHYLGNTSDQKKPAGTFGREIFNRLLIDLSWASSKLEGNTYSRLDTKRLIEYGQNVEGKDAIETQMILNHKDAIQFIVEDIDQIDINRHTLLNLHGLLSYDLLPNPEDSGRIRTKLVEISGTTYKPIGIPQIIDECFDHILQKGSQIIDPFEQAFFLMVHIPYLQPFIDVNKRVARLSANIPFIKNNLCPLTFIGMPEKLYVQGYLCLYELQNITVLKEVFISAYERSAQEYSALHQSLVEPDPERLKNRKHIQELIHFIVTKQPKNQLKIIDQYAKKNILPIEQSLFKKFILEELHRLHEGILARYRISPLDFRKWHLKQ